MTLDIVLLSLLCLGLFVSAVYETMSWATILMVVSGIYYHFWHQNVFKMIANNYQNIIPIGIGYLVIGIVWSFAKWVLFLLKFKAFRNDNWAAYNNDAWRYNGPRTFQGIFISDTPKASRFKPEIVGWMCWWPLSAIGTLINDPVRKAFYFAFDMFAGSYQRIADKIVPKMEESAGKHVDSRSETVEEFAQRIER